MRDVGVPKMPGCMYIFDLANDTFNASSIYSHFGSYKT